MSFKTRLLTACIALCSADFKLAATNQSETRSPLRLLVVMGHSRYSPADLLKTAGLAINARVTPSEMIDGCKTLAERGLLEKVNYRYALETGAGGAGYQLTLQVVETSDGGSDGADHSPVSFRDVVQDGTSGHGTIARQ